MSDYVLVFDDVCDSYPSRPPSLRGISFAF